MKKYLIQINCLLITLLLLAGPLSAWSTLGIFAADPAGPLPTEGTYLLYCPAAGGVIGPQVEDTAAPCMSVVPAKPVAGSDGKEETLKADGGGLIFTVNTLDEGGTRYYSFSVNGKYLAISENRGTENDEKLFLQDVLTDYCYFTLEKIGGGYVIYNKVAKYKYNPVCIEYYAGSFSGWTYKSSTSELFAFRFYPVEDPFGTGYVVDPSVEFQGPDSAYAGLSLQIPFRLNDLGEVQSCEAKVFFDGSTAGTPCAVTLSGYNGSVTLPAEDLTGHSVLKLRITAESRQNESFSFAYSGEFSLEILDLPSVTKPSPTPLSHVTAGTDVEISAFPANVGENPEFSCTVNGAPAKVEIDTKTGRAVIVPSELTAGTVTVALTVKRQDGKTAEKIWSFQYGKREVSPYFGQIHSHTEYSDGAGTLTEAYEHALGVADLDFLIVTDHSNYFDTTATATTDTAFHPESLTGWLEALSIAQKYNGQTKTDGSGKTFLTGYGYEMTWSGGPGHMNVFNSSGIVSRNSTLLNNKKNYAGMLTFYDLMCKANEEGCTQTSGSISMQFNHPGPTFGDFGDFTGYTKERDALINLLEVANGSGKVGGYGYYPSYEYFDRALSMGWHIAPTNNQDNHKGKWGDSNTARTVVLTDNFTLDGIYSAMSARHVYATEDNNLSVIYYLEDALQGDIISGYDRDTISITVSLYDGSAGDQLGYISVIGQDQKELYRSEYISSNTYELSVQLPNTSDYYYVKVVEGDGDIAVTAPVWINGESEDQPSPVEPVDPSHGSEPSDPSNSSANTPDNSENSLPDGSPDSPTPPADPSNDSQKQEDTPYQAIIALSVMLAIVAVIFVIVLLRRRKK